jgi:hypothetical protein
VQVHGPNIDAYVCLSLNSYDNKVRQRDARSLLFCARNPRIVQSRPSCCSAPSPPPAVHPTPRMQIWKSKVKPQTLSPVWNEEYARTGAEGGFCLLQT